MRACEGQERKGRHPHSPLELAKLYLDEVHARSQLTLIEDEVPCYTNAGLQLRYERLKKFTRTPGKD
jgi:hypothetical protein